MKSPTNARRHISFLWCVCASMSALSLQPAALADPPPSQSPDRWVMLAEESAAKIQDIEEANFSWLNIARAWHRLNNKSRALAALDHMKSPGDPRGEEMTLSNKMHALAEMNEFDRAQALATRDSIRDGALFTITKTAARNGQLTAAVTAMKQIRNEGWFRHQALAAVAVAQV